MLDIPTTFEILLRGFAICALALFAISIWRTAPRAPASIAALALAISVTAYVFNSSPTLIQAMCPYAWITLILSYGGVGFVWLFMATLFDDRAITPGNLIPPGILIVVGLIGFFWRNPESVRLWIAHNLIETVIALHALRLIIRSWRGDLLEARRRIRGPFLGIVAFYMMTLSAIEIADELGAHLPARHIIGAFALAVMCFAGAVVSLSAREELFGTPKPASEGQSAKFDAADRLELAKLNEAMGAGQAWRREGLTIGALAEQIGVPEHRLRRLINDGLGHRNFAAYVNARRIEAAKAALGQPSQARKTVSAIAFDLGFGSLGPFNRAFKEATGKTPTEWRTENLGEGSPNSEKAG